MSGFYSKAIVKIEAGTIGANISDFVSKVQVEKRLSDLEASKLNAQNAISFIENEKRVLKPLLKDMKH